jgi:hypothetical protein
MGNVVQLVARLLGKEPAGQEADERTDHRGAHDHVGDLPRYPQDRDGVDGLLDIP